MNSTWMTHPWGILVPGLVPEGGGTKRGQLAILPNMAASKMAFWNRMQRSEGKETSLSWVLC